MRRIVPITLAIAISACSGERLPLAPTAPSSSTTPTTPQLPSGPPAAKLSVTTFTVVRTPSSQVGSAGQYLYYAQLELADAAGTGAWVSGLVFTVPGGYNSSCAFPRIRVTPGAISWRPPEWCLDFESPGSPTTIVVTVAFSDDDGRSGQVQASAPVSIRD